MTGLVPVKPAPGAHGLARFFALPSARPSPAAAKAGILLAVLQIYLPIAGISLDAVALLVLGTVVGVLSGIFGIGGGFLLTPLLIFIGVPPAVAVASSANQLVGASVSGALATIGGAAISTCRWRASCRSAGSPARASASGSSRWCAGSARSSLVISLSYAFLLSLLGVLMLAESVRARCCAAASRARDASCISTPGSTACR